MLDRQNLIHIEGWERDHFGDYICEWKYDLSENEVEPNYEAFILTIQEQDTNDFRVTISVSLEGTAVGDLLSADYSESFENIDDAMDGGIKMISKLEDNYNINTRK
jgi:hypothetical protein